MDERIINAVGVITAIFFIVFVIWAFAIILQMNTETNDFLKTLEYRETERHINNETLVAQNITRAQIYNMSSNLSYVDFTTNLTANTMYEFNETLCDESVKNLGLNCTCFVCGRWVGYETKGFYNQSGTYYSNGTPTYMTYRQLADYEEMQSNIRYRQFMNERGIYWDGNKWR